MPTTAKEKPSPGSSPLIPERYLDIPSQRLYYLSLGLLCQAIKLIEFFSYIFGGDSNLSTCRKWLFVDFAYCALLSQLRIPKLSYSRAMVLLQIMILWFCDAVMFGGISLNLPLPFSSAAVNDGVSFTPESLRLIEYLAPLTLGLISYSSAYGDEHLLGQHTVRMSPISTAQLNPHGETFCLASPSDYVYVPVLLNNTNVAGLTYTLTPLGRDPRGQHRVDVVDLTSRDLKTIQQTRAAKLQLVQTNANTRNDEDYDEYDDDDEPSTGKQNPLQKTQDLVYIKLSKPGVIHLQKIYDSSNNEARIALPSVLTVAPCPTAEFIDDELSKQDVRCAGTSPDLEMNIKVYGVPPLSLRWLKRINGKLENLLVEGIEGSHEEDSSATAMDQDLQVTKRGPQEILLPLKVSVEAPGTYFYALDEIMDSLGNVVRVGVDTPLLQSSPSTQTKTSRSLAVLKRPTISFKSCRPGSPLPLLIGSDTSLPMGIEDGDDHDASWEVMVQYNPPADKANKRNKPWIKALKTQGTRRDLNIRASAPGDYTITGLKGKFCTGDVLAPETCKVVEKPLPTAEIEWKRIHECSGDTGVSASLILRGTPPFEVYFTTQRDNEPPRQLNKRFTSSRGEITLQPERSGHYVFTFTHLSDQHYKKIDLSGPSIDQVIHPPASADFVASHGGKNRKISTCHGNTVPVEVEMKGTGPWTLELQVVGPRSSENIVIENISSPRKTLDIPIPKLSAADNESFEINLVSIEDNYKCKRPITVPGIHVDVRGVKPTGKFYGSQSQRRTTVLEQEPASLPLRLTGDGPWRVKYRLVNSDRVSTRKLNNANDYLTATERGIYELVEVSDSLCPGSIITDASTYEVDWVPRPWAHLSSSTKSTFEAFNSSHILPSVCEGTPDHVDLDLKGRPPFQIMYNIAQDNEAGGTKLLDQPTFNSIQPRTRFQLRTSQPGRVYYEVKQIGDANYPLANHKDMIIPRSERLLFEQTVHMRPSAKFRSRSRLSYCLNDAFTPVDSYSSDGTVLLEGAPPFNMKLSIKSLVTSHVEFLNVEVPGHTWKVNLPEYQFGSIGPHHVTIVSIQDSSYCTPATLDPETSSIWVDIAETAAIIPFDRRSDYCVGDITQFQLEGNPPWNIGYRINSKLYSQEAKVSPFSLMQQQPGEFAITSVSHQQKSCKATVTDLRFNVRPLPSAQVGHGKRVYQDIHEGDQAEILFTLMGEPPFTFTYQRSEPSPRKGGTLGKVLETHTVTGIKNHEYSIFSALEGTWTVTSISDKYCRYPPAHPELDSERQR